ncbi:unnamed protein product, partial [Ixodes hexagonus]
LQLFVCNLISRALMVKLLQNLQDVYFKWEAKSKPRISRSADASAPRQRNGTPALQHDSNHGPQNGGKLLPRRVRNPVFNPGKYGVDKVRVPSLSHMQRSKVSFVDEVVPQLKQYPPPEEVRQLETLRYFALECCSKCLPMSKSSFTVDGSILLHGLDNALTLPSDGRSWLTPLKFIKNSIYLTCKNIPHEYKPISKKMLGSESIEHAIDRAVQVDPETDKKEHRRRAVSIFERMRATISTALLRLAVWLMHRLMSRMLTGVYVPKGQVDLLKRASEHNVPMVYLPLHRSHLDYILVTFLLYLNELKVPLVAAGDNLLIPLFGTLLRGLGGFFIKRRLDFKDGRKDHLYRAVLKKYMMEILKANHSLEFFLEGGRSRTGKTRLPKAGLLSVIVNCLNEELMQDVYIVPISISYEKILDGNFVSEQLGEPKVMETFTAALRSIWQILHSNYGCVRVDFCQPFSLREFLASARSQHLDPLAYDCPLSLLESLTPKTSLQEFRGSPSANSLYSADSATDDYRHAVQSLANHVVQRKFGKDDLMHRRRELFQLLMQLTLAFSLGLTGMHCLVVRHPLPMLPLSFGHSVSDILFRCGSTARPLRLPDKVLSMCADRNNVIYRPALFLHGLVELGTTSAGDTTKPACLKQLTMTEGLVTLHAAATISIAMKMSIFVSRFSSKFNNNLSITRRLYTHLTLLMIPLWRLRGSSAAARSSNEAPGCDAPYSCLTRDTLSCSDGACRLSDFLCTVLSMQVVLDEKNIPMLEFLQCILASYVESYWVVACSLSKLVNTQMEEKIFFRQIQKMAQDKLHQGLLYYEESFAADTLRNAVKLYERWGIVEHHTQDGMRILYLSEQWNSDEAVDSVISLVGAYRQ